MNRDSIRAVLFRYYEEPVSAFFEKLGFSPNGVTLLGLVVTCVSALFIGTGALLIGGLVMFSGAALDLIDGGLARRKGVVTKFGALLDSVSDRIQEAIVLLGLLIYYLNAPSESVLGVFSYDKLGAVLSYTAFIGSILVSYLRARSEGLGIECKIGIMTRPERVIALGLGLLVAHWIPLAVIIVLFALTVLGLITTAQRLYHSSSTLEGR